MIDTTTLRAQEFPWMDASDTIYLNAASTGPLPERSIVAQAEFTRRRAMPHLISFEEQFATLARCRSLLAEMIGADTSEIAVAINTGAGINLAAWGLPLGAGDEVVISDGEFPANVYPWLAAARSRGFGVHMVPTRDGVLDEEAMIERAMRPNVRVLAVSWVGFSSGAVADLDRLGAICRERGIFFFVDGIQGLGGLTLDLRRTHVDMFACGAQKWLLSPWGTGFTYVRRGMMSSLTPQPVSWMGVRDSDDFSRLVDYDLTWRDDARRFEQVTLAYQDFAGMAASLELLRDLGVPQVAAHIQACAAVLLDGARELGIARVTPQAGHGGIASLRPRDAMSMSERLDAASIIHSVREGTIRLAPHCYTTRNELARTLDVLASAIAAP